MCTVQARDTVALSIYILFIYLVPTNELNELFYNIILNMYNKGEKTSKSNNSLSCLHKAMKMTKYTTLNLNRPAGVLYNAKEYLN